jgi:hypothetical protein
MCGALPPCPLYDFSAWYLGTRTTILSIFLLTNSISPYFHVFQTRSSGNQNRFSVLSNMYVLNNVVVHNSLDMGLPSLKYRHYISNYV